MFVVVLGGWLGFSAASFDFSGSLFSTRFYGASFFSGSRWFMPFFFCLWCFFWSVGISTHVYMHI